MKAFYLFLFLYPILIFSQDYQPMLIDGNFWDVNYYNMDNEFFCYENPRRYTLGASVNFEGNEYREVNIHDIAYEEEACPGETMIGVNAEYHVSGVYIREDILAKKVYVWAKIEAEPYQEYLLYDFNLAIGEQLINAYIRDGEDVLIAAIQIDEEGRKVYTTNIMSYKYTEGVGGASGIIAPITYMFEAFDSLFCYGNNNTNQNNCLYYLAQKDMALEQVILFPNPVVNTLNINTNEKIELQIYSIVGKSIISYQIEQNTNLDISFLSPGIYFAQINTPTSNKIKTLTLIKQ